MLKAMTPLAVLSLSHLLMGTAIAAESENQDVTEMKPVTVNATRMEQKQSETNRPVAVVDKEKIEEVAPQSVAQAVKYEPNVTVAGGVIAGNQKINIRGLEGDKVLQVIDGARSNTNFSHRPSYFLDPELLSSVEVMKGASSSLWGSGAIGGVVVQNTIDAKDIVQEGESLGGFIKHSYQDNGEVNTSSFGVGAQGEKTSALVAGTYRDSEEMEQGNGDKLYGAQAENSTLLTKFGFAIDEHQALKLQYRYGDLTGHPPTVGSSDEASNEESDLIDREVTDQRVSFGYSHKGASDFVNLDTLFYFNNTENREVNTFGGTDESDIETIGLNLTNRFELGKTQILAGIDGYQDTIDTQRAVDESDPTGNRPEPPTTAETEVWGSFATLFHQLTPTIQAEAGLRYDSFETGSNDLGTSASEDNYSTSAGLRWQAQPWMLWRVRYDEAFRAPTSYEMYMQGTHFNYGAPGWDNSFVANPELKPEKAKNFELGVDLAFSNITEDDNLTLSATAFKTEVEDFIYLDVDTTAEFGAPPACNCIYGTSTYTNARDAKLWGYEIETRYTKGALDTSLSYGQTRGTHKTTVSTGTTEDNLPNIPADKWVADVSYGFWNIDTKAGVRVLYAEAQERVEDGGDDYDSYTITDLYTTWEPTSQFEGVKIGLTIANAFDKNYQQAWSEVYEPGRAIILSAKYSF